MMQPTGGGGGSGQLILKQWAVNTQTHVHIYKRHDIITSPYVNTLTGLQERGTKCFLMPYIIIITVPTSEAADDNT